MDNLKTVMKVVMVNGDGRVGQTHDDDDGADVEQQRTTMTMGRRTTYDDDDGIDDARTDRGRSIRFESLLFLFFYF